jgi:putative transposase
MIDRTHTLPLTRQSSILELSRSGIYYAAVPVKPRDLEMMRLIDELHIKYPFWGSRSIRDELRGRGFSKLGRGHVSTLMKKMGIEALYKKPRLSSQHPEHKTYPYLLRGLDIISANHVWATDITYLPMAKGFCYLTAVMDWATRKVLAWRLSNTLDTSFCVDALEEAIALYGVPEIFNTDQGSQFTSEEFTKILIKHGIAISMDGKGRWRDNVFVERLWKSVKYEEVYLKAYGSIAEARKELGKYFEFYNQRRRHQGLDRKTPDEVYRATLPELVAA